MHSSSTTKLRSLLLALQKKRLRSTPMNASSHSSSSWKTTLLRTAKFLWAAPCTVVGLVLAGFIVLAGGKAKWSNGALEVTYRNHYTSCGPLARKLPFRGIVFGHVILAVTRDELQTIGAHERVHVQQYERWGPLFFVAYAASSLWQLLHARDPYWYNHFETQARELGDGRGG